MKKIICVAFIMICLCAILFGCSQQTTKTDCSIISHRQQPVAYSYNDYYNIFFVQLFFNSDYYNHQINGDFRVKYIYTDNGILNAPCAFDAELNGSSTMINNKTLFQPNTYVYFEINDRYRVDNTWYDGYLVDVQVMDGETILDTFHLNLTLTD